VRVRIGIRWIVLRSSEAEERAAADSLHIFSASSCTEQSQDRHRSTKQTCQVMDDWARLGQTSAQLTAAVHFEGCFVTLASLGQDLNVKMLSIFQMTEYPCC
jgi:hypothetical protein